MRVKGGVLVAEVEKKGDFFDNSGDKHVGLDGVNQVRNCREVIFRRVSVKVDQTDNNGRTVLVVTTVGIDEPML